MEFILILDFSIGKPYVIPIDTDEDKSIMDNSGTPIEDLLTKYGFDIDNCLTMSTKSLPLFINAKEQN